MQKLMTIPELGSITWIDLTVEDAEGLRDFYARVVGWVAGSVSMGDYNDFTMNTPATGEPVAGICHARGSNEGLPAQWLIYVTVADLDASLAACVAAGGTIHRGAQPCGEDGRYAVIEDPAGACLAIYEPYVRRTGGA